MLKYQKHGLENIYLTNGYTSLNHDGYDENTIHNHEELEEKIGRLLSSKCTRLHPNELRFLREKVGIGEIEFAKKINVCAFDLMQMEKGKIQISLYVDSMVRFLFLRALGDEIEIGQALKGISLSEECNRQAYHFYYANQHWIAA